MIQSLTKENFWNELYEKYTGEVEVFCEWIDEYKRKNNWNELFSLKCGGYSNSDYRLPERYKFHDLPIAMQIGIFLQFVAETNSRYGVEITVERMSDFEKIPEIIKEFFFYERDNAIQDHRDAKWL